MGRHHRFAGSLAKEAVRAAEAELLESVGLARFHGRSWNLIAIPLGVSGQAARERFAEKVTGAE